LIRLAGALALALTVAACDKCGDFNINLPKLPGANACAPQTPQSQALMRIFEGFAG
jgi:hypothetical protein